MVTEGGLTLDGKHTMKYTHDVSYNCTHETYIILITKVTPINLMKKCFKKISTLWILVRIKEHLYI